MSRPTIRMDRARRLGGGCHLNRAIGTLIENAGFQFDRLETGYMRGPKPMTFMYEGSARSRLAKSQSACLSDVIFGDDRSI